MNPGAHAGLNPRHVSLVAIPDAVVSLAGIFDVMNAPTIMGSPGARAVSCRYRGRGGGAFGVGERRPDRGPAPDQSDGARPAFGERCPSAA